MVKTIHGTTECLTYYVELTTGFDLAVYIFCGRRNDEIHGKKIGFCVVE